MDISKFDLQGLQLLHNSFQSVLKNHEEQLSQRLESGDISEIEKHAIEYKIEHFKKSIAEIEEQIKNLNSEKLRFSVEYIFWNFGLPRKSFQVQFLTTSEAYQKYGSHVTGIALFEKEDMPELIEAAKNGRWTDGKICFQENVNDQMTEEQKKELKTNGFMASEIDSISWV
jgi:hypothetical protein